MILFDHVGLYESYEFSAMLDILMRGDLIMRMPGSPVQPEYLTGSDMYYVPVVTTTGKYGWTLSTNMGNSLEG